MRYKDGVSPVGLHWRMRKVLKVAEDLWVSMGEELVVTGACEDGHSKWSWHPYGCAVDLRTNTIPSSMSDAIAKELRHVLRAPYQVINHTDLGDSNHIHIEFDPVAFGLDN